MKRNSKIIIFFSIVIALTLFVCATVTLLKNKRGDYEIAIDLNEEGWNMQLLKMSQQKDIHMYSKKELEEHLEDMYYPIEGGVEILRSSAHDVMDMKEILDFSSVEKTTEGFIIKYVTKTTTYVVITSPEGSIEYMNYQGKKLPDIKSKEKIKKGMNRDDFKKIFPEAIISTHLPKMSDKNRPKRDRPITTITFNNGEQIVVEFKKKYKGIKQYFKQEYVVDNFYEIGAFRIE